MKGPIFAGKLRSPVTPTPQNQTWKFPLIRSRLKAADLHPFITNENVAQWLGGLSNATTLRIEVPEVEAAEAVKVLAAPPE